MNTPLDKLRAAFRPVGVCEVHGTFQSQVWATWSPESGGTRYDILLTPVEPGAFGRSGQGVVAICGTPGIQRVAFLSPTADTLAVSYVKGHFDRGSVGRPFSTMDLYRLTEMLAALLGREAHLPEPGFHLRAGDTPFVVPEDLL